MQRIEFVGQSMKDADNPQANTSRLVNFYREPVGGVAGYALKSVLGTETLAATELLGRSMAEIDGKFYVMSGGNLYRVTEGGTATLQGATVSADGARIFGAENGKVCTVSKSRYFVWDGSTMTEPTAGAFSEFGSGVFFGNYVVLTEANGRRFCWSDLADAGTLPALNFATAESTDTNILRAMVTSGRLWLMKPDVIEVWIISGQSGANAIQALTGSVIPKGLKARDLVASFSGGLFFVGDDDIAYISGGQGAQPISGPAVNTAIAQGTPTHCFTYEDEGHNFCVIRFSDRPAWVYDIVTGEWHERASGDNQPWNVTETAKTFGKWYGIGALGNVYEFKRNNLDDTDALIRTAEGTSLYDAGKYFRVPYFEATGRTGLGDATLRLQTSDDGGRTWSLEKGRSMGALGDYTQRMQWHGLGRFNRFTARLRVSDAVDATLDARVNLRVA